MRGSRGSVAVVGGGIIGLSCAWRLAHDGWSVTLFDAAPETREASWAAAGMLAPHNEATATDALWRLGCDSLVRWPSFLAGLEVDAEAVGYRDRGSLVPAIDDEDRDEIERRAVFLAAAGVPIRMLDAAATARSEPALGSAVMSSLLVPGACVDPRAVTAILRERCTGLGVAVRFAQAVTAITACGLELADGTWHATDQVVLACGAWTPDLARATGIELSGRPIRGQMLRFAGGDDLITRFIHSRHAYLVPRPGRGIVVGATMVDAGFARDEDSGAIATLTAGAHRLVPALAQLPIAETWTGLRPRLDRILPIIDRHPSGVVVATGHFRNGILLAPITADLVAHLAVGTGHPPPDFRFPH